MELGNPPAASLRVDASEGPTLQWQLQFPLLPPSSFQALFLPTDLLLIWLGK